ncbi:WD40-repeat-containing domain protein [Lanmaoa asiatica]|nr:WD40-repeat-containing domain protein [Lanmaoa asiatica]
MGVWDAITHERVVESIDAHEQKITALDVSPDGSKIASGSQDGTVIVWCLETGQRLAGPFKQGRSVLSVRFSPMGDRLASAGWHHSIHVWNVCGDGGQFATSIPTDPVFSLAWSSDGRRLFAGCHWGSILCFDVSSSTPTMSKWPGHPHVDSISTLRLSNNDKFIISASSSECSVKIWDVHTRAEIGSLKHTTEVLDAEISFDDGRLVISAKDGKISIWNLRKVLPMSYFFQLTDVGNAAYVSWRQAELARAEEILSSEIGRSSGPLHYHLANRALVRARRRQWDGALDDAQTQSLIALLAKSVAQSGQERCNAAIETLDIAIENGDREEKDFVRLVKAITFFDAGLHDEAIRHVNDLAVSSPDVKHPCAFVQASSRLVVLGAILSIYI